MVVSSFLTHKRWECCLKAEKEKLGFTKTHFNMRELDVFPTQFTFDSRVSVIWLPFHCQLPWHLLSQCFTILCLLNGSKIWISEPFFFFKWQIGFNTNNPWKCAFYWKQILYVGLYVVCLRIYMYVFVCLFFYMSVYRLYSMCRSCVFLFIWYEKWSYGLYETLHICNIHQCTIENDLCACVFTLSSRPTTIMAAKCMRKGLCWRCFEVLHSLWSTVCFL